MHLHIAHAVFVFLGAQSPDHRNIEIIDIECGLLSRVSQKIVATKWRIYKGKINSPRTFCAKANGNV